MESKARFFFVAQITSWTCDWFDAWRKVAKMFSQMFGLMMVNTLVKKS